MSDLDASTTSSVAEPMTAEAFSARLNAEDAALAQRMQGPIDEFLATLPDESDPSLSKEQREYIQKFRQLLRHQHESFKRKVADRNRAYCNKFKELHASNAVKR